MNLDGRLFAAALGTLFVLYVLSTLLHLFFAPLRKADQKPEALMRSLQGSETSARWSYEDLCRMNELRNMCPLFWPPWACRIFLTVKGALSR
jgi:hypothetical protein